MKRSSPGCVVAIKLIGLNVAVRANADTWAPDHAPTIRTAGMVETTGLLKLFNR